MPLTSEGFPIPGTSRQNLLDGGYLDGYQASDPKLDNQSGYPVTGKDLNALIITGGRVDPNLNTVRKKGGKIGSQSSQLLVNQDSRTLNLANNPYAAQTQYCAYSLPGMGLDTRRIDSNSAIVSPYALS